MSPGDSVSRNGASDTTGRAFEWSPERWPWIVSLDRGRAFAAYSQHCLATAGIELRALRTQHRLRLKDVTAELEKLGSPVHVSTVSRYERAELGMLKIVLELCYLYDLAPSQFFLAVERRVLDQASRVRSRNGLE